MPLAANLPRHLAPMLASTSPLPETEQRWAWEPKWDGWRVLLWGEGGQLRAVTRAGHDVTGLFPELDPLGATLGRRDAILDGELVETPPAAPEPRYRAGDMFRPAWRRAVAIPIRAGLRVLARTDKGRQVLSRIAGEVSTLLAPSSAVDSPDQIPSARHRWHTSERPQPYATRTRPALRHFSTVCWLDDWRNPTLANAMRRQLPYYVDDHPEFPHGFEHRKHWENAQLVVGLEQLGAVRDEAVVLSVGAGHEEALYDLSTRVRWLFATDVYGAGQFRSYEADDRMLIDPDHFVRCPYNRNRLVVQNMDALDLRFDDRTFDAVYSLSSIEHFGGVAGAQQALSEMRRVLKPGGIAAVTTECIVNGASAYSEPGLELFTPTTLRELFWTVPGLVPVQEPCFTLSEPTQALSPTPLQQAVEDASLRGFVSYPSILLELAGRVFTSFSVFLRRDRTDEDLERRMQGP